jgi:hypothetical protein
VEAFNSTFRNHTGNNLVAWLKSLCDPEDVDRVLMDYRVGTYTGKRTDMHGAAFFWLINKDGEVTTGHAIKYDTTGHRDKSQHHDNLWAHHAITQKSATDLGVPECFFGEHLLKEKPDAQVGVVESEKTAIIASIFYPGMVWVATGGCTKLSRRKMRVLKGRNVILYPDVGNGYRKWCEMREDLSAYFLTEGSLVVSDILECIALPTEADNDIADYLLPFNFIAEANVDIFPDIQLDIREDKTLDTFVEPPAAPTISEAPEMDTKPDISPVITKLIERNPAIATLINLLELDTQNITISHAPQTT